MCVRACVCVCVKLTSLQGGVFAAVSPVADSPSHQSCNTHTHTHTHTQINSLSTRGGSCDLPNGRGGCILLLIVLLNTLFRLLSPDPFHIQLPLFLKAHREREGRREEEERGEREGGGREGRERKGRKRGGERGGRVRGERGGKERERGGINNFSTQKTALCIHTT